MTKTFVESIINFINGISAIWTWLLTPINIGSYNVAPIGLLVGTTATAILVIGLVKLVTP